MDLLWFRDLGLLARTGNFSEAAKLGNISQPALSRRIKALEHWVGSDLVDRSRHPVTLTNAGTQMLEAGQQALLRLESERGQIRETQSLPDQYVVTFGTPHSIGWRFFPAWLQSFEDAFGPIISRLRADDLPNCVRDLREEEVDFLIAYDSDQAKSVQPGRDYDSVLIGRDALIPVCKLAADGRPIFDLGEGGVEVPYLRFGTNAPISDHLEPLLRARNL